jgi:SAM-dependent methyltransferase
MPYVSRWDFIRPLVVKKRVLELGPAELVGTMNRHKIDRWIHRKIAGVAEKLVGLEINREQIEALSDMGYDIREGDAEQFDLNEQFDVIIAGELIEHLSNPGKFLDCVRKQLVTDGQLVLTTPNRYSVLSLANVILSGKVPSYEKDIAKHVVYFDSDALNSLLRRHGFASIEFEYCKWVGAPSPRLLIRQLVNIVSTARPAMLPVLLASARKVE